MKKFYLANVTGFKTLLLTLTLLSFFDTGFAQSVLPAYCTHSTATLPVGWTVNSASANTVTLDGCGGTSFNLNAANDAVVVNYNAAATNFSFYLNINTTGSTKTIQVQESSNGATWTVASAGTASYN